MARAEQPSPTPAAWPARYQRLRLLCAGGDFQVHAVADRQQDGRQQVLIVPSANVDEPVAARALQTLAEAHRRVVHPTIAPLATAQPAAEASSSGHVALDFPAVADGLAMLRRVSRQGRQLPYGAADAFITSTRDGMLAAHQQRHPLRDAPLCMGRLAYSNLLFAADGRHVLFGLGHNVITDDAEGVFGGDPGCFQAPEVALSSEAASPRGDYLALLLMMRSLLPLVQLPPALLSVALGHLPPPEDAVLRSSLEWFNEHVYSAAPEDRASIDEAVAKSVSIRMHFGLELEPELFRQVVAEVLDEAGAPLRELQLGPGARWLAVAGSERRAVSGRGPMRGMLLALAAQAQAQAPQAAGLSRDELFAAGWPEQRAEERSRANRVYVALNKLRKLGLRDVIEHSGDGYRIQPGWRVTIATE